MKGTGILRKCAWAALLVLCVYGATLAYLIVRTPPDMDERFRPKPREPFSAQKWGTTRFGDPLRYKMANDLVRSGKLLGMGEAEVRSLLGAPTSEDRVAGELWIGYDLASQRQFPAGCFLLPSWLFMNSDTWLLEVRLKDEKLRTVKIRFT